MSNPADTPEKGGAFERPQFSPNLDASLESGDRPMTFDDLEKIVANKEASTPERIEAATTPEELFDALPERTKAEILAGRKALAARGTQPGSMRGFDLGNSPTRAEPIRRPRETPRIEEPEKPLNRTTLAEQEAGRARLDKRRTDHQMALDAQKRAAVQRLKEGIIDAGDMDYNPQG